MYLIFKLHKKGFPVNQIYEEEVKPVSTRRFNNELMEMGNIDATSGTQVNGTPDLRGESYISFDSEGSYSTMGLVKVELKPKPEIIPNLVLDGLPEYVSSDEEEVQQQDDVYMAALQGKNKNKNKSF